MSLKQLTVPVCTWTDLEELVLLVAVPGDAEPRWRRLGRHPATSAALGAVQVATSCHQEVGRACRDTAKGWSEEDAGISGICKKVRIIFLRSQNIIDRVGSYCRKIQ